MIAFDVGMILDVDGFFELGIYDTVVVQERENLTDVIEEYYKEEDDVVIIWDDIIKPDTFMVLLPKLGIAEIWTRI